MKHFTHFTEFDECVRYLTTEIFKTTLALRRNELAFEHSKDILNALGNPQDRTPTIHIAATSGKGSIGYGIDAILRAHGFQTTLMVSPHAYDIRERMQQNGQLISKKAFVGLTNDLIDSMARSNLAPTYFEALMSMGFMAAKRQHGNYVVAETGLGGLWDTSNTITRPDKVAVVGSIGFDHTHILGSTLEEIAAQKAGIMPFNGTAIVLRQGASINEVFTETAKERNTTIIWVAPAVSAYETNRKMARTTAEYIANRDGWTLNEALTQTTLEQLYVPARFEVRKLHDQTVVLDAAHNPQKASALVDWISQNFPNQKFITILAISEGKDAEKIIQILNPITDSYILTAFLTNQQDMPVHALPISDLAEIVKKYGDSVPYRAFPTAQQALSASINRKTKPLLITGSFYLVGELGNALKNL